MELNKKSVFIFLFIIVLIGTFFRLWQLDSIPPGLYHDEAINGNTALEALDTGKFKQFYPENNGREGLYINLLAIPLKIFGNETWALRLVSAFFGILTVIGMFFFTRELFRNNRVALFASFFIAISFWHIVFSRIGFRGIMAPFFLVWALAFLYCASRKEKIIYSALGGILFGLGFHTYIAYRIAPLLLIVPFALLIKKRQTKYIAFFLLGTFLAGLPLGLYFLENPADFVGRATQVSIFTSESPSLSLLKNIGITTQMFFAIGDLNWRHNLSGSPQLFWPVALLFAFGLYLSFKKIWALLKTNNKLFHLLTSRHTLLFLWMIVMSIPVVVSNEGLPHALRAIILIPPIFVFVALGLHILIEKIENWLKKKTEQNPDNAFQLARLRKKFVILLFVFLIALTSYSYTKYFIRWGKNIYTYNSFNGRYYDIGKYLSETTTTSFPKYVIVNTVGVYVRGIPMPAQTVMFPTNTYSRANQEFNNIHYLNQDEIELIKCDEHCSIVSLKNDHLLREKIKNRISGLKLDITPGFEILGK